MLPDPPSTPGSPGNPGSSNPYVSIQTDTKRDTRTINDNFKNDSISMEDELELAEKSSSYHGLVACIPTGLLTTLVSYSHHKNNNLSKTVVFGFLGSFLSYSLVRNYSFTWQRDRLVTERRIKMMLKAERRRSK